MPHSAEPDAEPSVAESSVERGTNPADLAPQGSTRFQFSMKTMLLVLTGAAVLLGLVPLFPYSFTLWITQAILLGILTVSIMCAFYARGKLQTFAMGVMVPCTALVLSGGLRTPSMLFQTILLSGLCGSVALWTRRWLEKPGHDHGEDPQDLL